ncbi:MAG TPA: GGDEF domain-containing protein [Solirubrobacterales bacterium]|nr:GGDEF domain-containing protein [Solirubrobacterales bacterium]
MPQIRARSETLTKELERSARQRHRLSCSFFDIDHFKAINDEHGHVQGNVVLARAGDALLGSARAFDCVGRFGGDEFVVVMPETSLSEAHGAAKRMCIEMRKAISDATGLKVTASAGVAEWERGNSMLELLEASDRALQAAKAMGGKEIYRGSPPRRRLAPLAGLVRARPKPKAKLQGRDAAR